MYMQQVNVNKILAEIKPPVEDCNAVFTTMKLKFVIYVVHYSRIEMKQKKSKGNTD